MKIIDLDPEHEDIYYACLEDWNEEVKEAGDHKKCWYQKMAPRGLMVKLALNEKEETAGMIQYIPIEYSFAAGAGLAVILCVWVHGYRKKGVGDQRKKGYGKALLEAAEEDARKRGYRGMAAWGVALPFWMRASWYKKQGYRKADQDGFLGPVLLWKPFGPDAVKPQWIRQRKKPEKIAGQVIVTGIVNGWCTAQNMVFERARRAASEFGGKVAFREIRTDDRDTFLEWGVSDALYINDKKVQTGPPPSFEKIRKKIARQVSRL
jgi:GNAT superfamily N-acetyltransferase